jgi:formate dehydrogenase gamma subunit
MTPPSVPGLRPAAARRAAAPKAAASCRTPNIVLCAFAALLFIPLVAQAQKSEDCLICHSDNSLTMKKGGKTVPLFVDAAKLKNSVHGSSDCVDCHKGFKPDETPHAKVIRPVNCQSCHEIAAYDKSVHGRGKDAGAQRKGDVAATCKDCHGTHNILSPSDPKSPTNKIHLSSVCGKCHEDVVSHFSRSAHGVALEQGIKGAPSCVDCHGEHNVENIDNKQSPVYKGHEAKVCLKCHLDNPEVRQRVGPSAGFIAGYETSVHGVALAAGNEKAATCSNCHGAHDMKKVSDTTSRVNRWSIPKTCGQCHAEIARTYNESIHGTALQWGNKEAPSCTDCHGEHQIYAPRDPRSRVAARNVSVQVCAPCHSSVRLNEKYGLAVERFKTFEDSYHGLASKGGQVQVANCASCHGVHNIKPSSDPTSTINKANLAATCGQCHPGANNNFSKGSVHVILSPNGDKVLYWIRTIYIGLIVSVIGGMLLHNLLDIIRKSQRLMAVRAGRIPQHHYGTAQFVRMSLNERIQHALMFSSFIVLVITGFMLKFPDAWWVVPIRQMSEKVFAVRSLTHRIAGVVMTLVSAYHLYYILFVKRGRRFASDMMPKLTDVRDFYTQVKYYLGLSKTRAQFHRFGYAEKAEYWALVWGVIVMAGTGVVMWFDNFSINLLTKLGWDISRTIHYYEACLATLAIVVWHFYFVIFNPDVYPMSTAWWTGKLTEEEMAAEHPLELEQIRSEQLKQLDKPASERARD